MCKNQNICNRREGGFFEKNLAKALQNSEKTFNFGLEISLGTLIAEVLPINFNYVKNSKKSVFS